MQIMPISNDPPFKSASVQAAPVFLNRKATVDKACDLIAAARREGARLMCWENYMPLHQRRDGQRESLRRGGVLDWALSRDVPEASPVQRPRSDRRQSLAALSDVAPAPDSRTVGFSHSVV